MIIPITRNPINKFTVARLHYSLDPEKNTREWLAEAKRGMPDNGFKREYEIDYSYFAGKPVFDFNEFNIHPVTYTERETLYRGWDYGFHRPCCVITKLNQQDQWGIIHVILGKDESIRAFGLRVRNYCLSTYPGAKYIDADDIAGIHKSDKSELSSRQMLNAIGIYPQGRKQEINEGLTIIRQKLNIRVDGKPGLIVDPSNTDVIDGFKGGIHYPEAKEGKTESEFYEKDGYYDHIFDALRYIGVEMFTLLGQKEQTNDIARSTLEWQWRDGRPRMSMDTNEIQEEGGINELLGGSMSEEIV